MVSAFCNVKLRKELGEMPSESLNKQGGFMGRKAFWGFLVAVLLVAPVAMQAQGDYLDVYIAHVKPEKVADFTALAKKMVDANRRNIGVFRLAQTVMYGDVCTYAALSL